MSAPSVTTSLIDRSHYIPHMTNEVGAFVGVFEKGPIDKPVFITDVNDFKFIFGRGIDIYHNDWYQVYNYLQYSSGLWVVRTSGAGQYNANNGPEITVLDQEDWENKFEDISIVSDNVRIIAKTPGEAGNLLEISIFGETEFNQNTDIGYGNKSKNIFTFFESGNLGIVIFRNKKIVEKFYISSSDYEKVLSASLYCFFKVDNNLFSNYNTSLIKLETGFTTYPSAENIYDSYDILKNKEMYDIDIVIGNEMDNQIAIDFVETRRDCIAFIGLPTKFINILTIFLPSGKEEVLYTPQGDIFILNKYNIQKEVTQDLMNKINEYIGSLTKSQYVHFTGNVKEQYDGFSQKMKYVNIAGDTGGLKAQASYATPWLPGAGLEKGLLKNLNQMVINYNSDHKKYYYKEGINYVENGIVQTQKTFYTKSSAFERINIRSLFNHIEKTVEKSLRRYVFERNELNTRRAIASDVKRMLEDIKTNKGIEAGRVHVHPDPSNESSIIVDVYIKPLYMIEYIQLRMINAGTQTFTSVLTNTL